MQILSSPNSTPFYAKRAPSHLTQPRDVILALREHAMVHRFLIKPDRVASRSDMDSKEDAIVLFRSIAGEHLG